MFGTDNNYYIQDDGCGYDITCALWPVNSGENTVMYASLPNPPLPPCLRVRLTDGNHFNNLNYTYYICTSVRELASRFTRKTTNHKTVFGAYLRKTPNVHI